MKHNFHAVKYHIEQSGGKANLPEDINDPVIDFLENKVNCKAGADELREFQKHVQYGKIRLVHDDVPDASINISVCCGMAADGYETYTVKKHGKWTVITSKTVKNSNIEKKREK
jgi:hypothetical protein